MGRKAFGELFSFHIVPFFGGKSIDFILEGGT